MNYSTINTTWVSCTDSFRYWGNPLPETLSSELRAEFIFRIAVNAIRCPFVILLNILFIVAVKTKRQLRTNSNMSLACLATTDLVVRLLFNLCTKDLGERGTICHTLAKIRTTISSIVLPIVLNQLKKWFKGNFSPHLRHYCVTYARTIKSHCLNMETPKIRQKNPRPRS